MYIKSSILVNSFKQFNIQKCQHDSVLSARADIFQRNVQSISLWCAEQVGLQEKLTFYQNGNT